MTLPASTYRLQFRNGMTLDRAAAIVPYLKALGISHLYASPIFTAVSGSTHGYDITDANEIDPAIGGRAGFDRLAAALQTSGLGLIIDIVPNHMAASLENAWWRSVLKLGRTSPHARHFDIDWSKRLTLPQLGKPFEQALADGELMVVRDKAHDTLAIGYFENLFPLNPESSAEVMAATGGDEARLGEFSRDTARMTRLHEQQHWQLLPWKEAARHLSYRRFFEVTGLVGVRVEDEAVFRDTHRLVLALVRARQVQGLRVDHVDGLADPRTYLRRLRRAAGPETYITVEKILGRGESLPQSWPVSGTTGYEFVSALNQLFIESDGLRTLDQAYDAIADETAEFGRGLRAAKQLMIERNFAGETRWLVRIAQGQAGGIDDTDLTAALCELLIAFPVYRIYGTRGPLDQADAKILDEAVHEAASHLPDQQALDLVASLLRGEIDSDDASEFRIRFQQLSGPIMAKAMEDTLFYRYNRLIAANEVGGEPGETPRGTDAFHALMRDRLQRQPHGLSPTSTHDTKRGEDARARLYTLSEGADVWAQAVVRWQEMNRNHLADLPDGVAPEPNIEWMLYQALAGFWPEDFEGRNAEEFAKRFTDYALKAVREAKLRTDWLDQNGNYEEAICAYACCLVSADNIPFLEDFGMVLRPFLQAGYVNSLSQTLIKLTAPGIPDIYQGAEGFDFSLVDPDNRRPVDFDELSGWLANDAPLAKLTAPALKQRIIRMVLRFRREHSSLFAEGHYLPLDVKGTRKNHLTVFARQHADQFAITVVPRLMFGWLDPGVLFAGPEFWDDTAIVIPPQLKGLKNCMLTGKLIEPGDQISAAAALGEQPVALIVPI
jgi:(1->4)-alpha-D-glucan 1-alpha-D-glucosylmutase